MCSFCIREQIRKCVLVQSAKKVKTVAFYKYVQAGYTSREGGNFELPLAAHQIVVNVWV